ncbi:hypothetical protein COF04_03730 [Bacillus toyonensis]|uniref:homing endonuclease associated repeat-containing protein n=1 Tax=Bacillus toyonensis TaxID=155322 RepID=UPI000BFB6167|nr:hypothetical protein [Bacillus toyonensis]PHC05697.1 hypothetical protein COF04_03730 [Bacillus toyonensis]
MAKEKYTKEFLIKEFWRYYNEYGVYPLSTDLRKNKTYPHCVNYERNWGSWSKFSKDIGVLGDGGWYKCDENVLKEKYMTCTKEEIINSLMIKRSWNTIRKKAISMGFRKAKKRLTDLELKNFICDYNSGMTIKDIAMKYNYSDNANIYHLVNKYIVNKRNNRWTQEQIKILEEKYPYEDWDVLLKKLSPFGKEDIIVKAYKLGVVRECYGWSVEELNILTTQYEVSTFKEIRELLPNKSETAIWTKASKLGLVIREKWGEEEVIKLKETYPYYTNEELLKFFPNRTIKSISSMASKILKLKKSLEYKEKYKNQTQKMLIGSLIDFASSLNRTPTSIEIQENPNMSGIMSYHRYFGSYANACKQANLEVNQNIFGRSYHFISKNGDRCLSSKELEITNIFIANNLLYEKEVLYRDFLEDETMNLIRMDWLMDGKIVVEYFGMLDKDYYRERMDYKIQLSEVYNFNMISILPNDLKNGYSGMIDKFRKFNIEIILL